MCQSEFLHCPHTKTEYNFRLARSRWCRNEMVTFKSGEMVRYQPIWLLLVYRNEVTDIPEGRQPMKIVWLRLRCSARYRFRNLRTKCCFRNLTDHINLAKIRRLDGFAKLTREGFEADPFLFVSNANEAIGGSLGARSSGAVTRSNCSGKNFPFVYLIK